MFSLKKPLLIFSTLLLLPGIGLLVFAEKSITNTATVSNAMYDNDRSNNTAQVIDLVTPALQNGHLYFDTNNNGIQESGELDAGGLNLRVNYSDGTFIIITTDLQGNYTFPVNTDQVKVVLDQPIQGIPIGTIVVSLNHGLENNQITSLNTKQKLSVPTKNLIRTGGYSYNPR